MFGHSKWGRFFLAQSLVAVLAVLVACTQPQAPTPAASTPSKTAAQQPTQAAAEKTAPPKAAKPTGEVVIALPDLAMEQFDPSKTRPLLSAVDVGGYIYESLYQHMPPNGEVRPWLLESGTSAPDNMSWTFKLKDGKRFSNGDPMTAEDVKFSFDRYRSPESVSPQAGQFRKAIKDVTVVDRLTVRVDLNEPTITMPLILAGSMGNEGVILPKKYIEQVSWEEFNKKPIGSGPYKMVEHKAGESITYEAVENHPGSTPSFAKVRLVKVPEEQSRLAMLKSGQADLVYISADKKKDVEQAGFKAIVVPYTTMWQINFYGDYGQYPASPISKPEVRKALNLAVDKQAILDQLNAGAGQVAAVTPSAPGFSVGAPKDLKPTPFDPAQAKRLLQQAGYPDGFEITFYSIPVPQCPNYRQLAETIASYWQQIGVKTQIRPIEYSVFRPLFSGKEHAPQIVGTAANHCAILSPIALNDLGVYYWSKGVVKLTDVADIEIEKAQSAKSTDELVQYSEAAYRKLYESSAVIPILYGGDTWGASKKVADLPVVNGVDRLTTWLIAEKP